MRLTTRSNLSRLLVTGLTAVAPMFAALGPADAQHVRHDPSDVGLLSTSRSRPAGAALEEPARSEIVINEPTLALAAKLDSPDYHERESVAEQLKGESIQLAELFGLLESDRLNAEQRYRMLEIIRHRLLHAPRGAVGIQMQPRAGGGAQPGLEVMAVLDGLPAKGVLLPGDRITHIDGRPVLHQLDLITYVQNKSPGEQIELAVQRPIRAEGEAALQPPAQRAYESLTIDLALGSADKLNDFDDVPPSNPVLSARRTQAMMIASSFAPRPRTIDVPGMRPEPSPPERVWVVDDHPVIEALRTHREMVLSNPDLDTEQLRAMWQMTLEWILDEAENPLLSDLEREQLVALAERYAALIPPPPGAEPGDNPGALEEQPR